MTKTIMLASALMLLLALLGVGTAAGALRHTDADIERTIEAYKGIEKFL